MKRWLPLLLLVAFPALADPPLFGNTKSVINTGPLVAIRDGGSDQVPLYILKGTTLSGGSQSVTACWGGAVLTDGVSCSNVDGRSQYWSASSDAYFHTGGNLQGDNIGAEILWRGQIESQLVGSNGAAFYASGASAFGIMGTGTIASLPASSASTTGAHTFVTDAGRPYYNQGTGWYPYAGLGDLLARDFMWTAQCQSASTVSCANEDANWNAAFLPVTSNVNAGNVTCGWEAAGVNGAGTGAAVVGIYRTSGTPAYVCSCTYGANSCDDAANGVMTCNGCSGSTLNVSDTYVLRWHTDSDCTTLPTRATCNVPLTAAAY